MRRLFNSFLITLLLVVTLSPSIASAGSISIEPIRQVIELGPGQTVAKTLTVYNSTKASEGVKVNATSFNTTNKHYDYDFGAPPDLSSWIQFIEDSAIIEPGQQHIFSYNVAVPNGAEPGGKYIAIFASLNTLNQTSGQAISERAGSLVYLTVTGKDTRSGSLLSYSSPSLVFSANDLWSFQIQNKGNTHFTSRTETTISEWNGHVISSVSQDHIILPGTIREIDGSYKLGKWPDVYRIKLRVGLGDNADNQTTHWLIYLPPISSTVILIVFICAVVLMTRKLLKSKSRKS